MRLPASNNHIHDCVEGGHDQQFPGRGRAPLSRGCFDWLHGTIVFESNSDNLGGPTESARYPDSTTPSPRFQLHPLRTRCSAVRIRPKSTSRTAAMGSGTVTSRAKPCQATQAQSGRQIKQIGTSNFYQPDSLCIGVPVINPRPTIPPSAIVIGWMHWRGPGAMLSSFHLCICGG